MNSFQNIDVALQLAREHEAALRPPARLAQGGRSRSQVRRWLGRKLVRTGFWLAYEQPMVPAR